MKKADAFKDACKNIKLLLFDCDGVLTDGRIVLGNDGIELKFFSTFDGMGLKIWHMAGLAAGCITGRASGALTKRAQELKFDELHQNIADKNEALYSIMKQRGLKPEEVAYIGDDINDLPVGTKVGLFFVPANHHEVIRPYADYILSRKGGFGAVREAIDIILTHKGLLEDLVKSFADR